ncbi:MAG: hypothetical protein A2289_27090 [Deltaproteobacteria bacterium RIFOXYA12_FULL_58_15]|nr:MAG: hypothetical protein A2289_27090 [Deltaproteobacteria bacterium RIFOXYA12_FULL_58_15]
MIDVAQIKTLVEGHGLVRDVEKIERGHVRIETAFLYPDGASIDVFLVEDAPLLPPVRLSDLGQTTSWLLDVQVKPWLSKKRRTLLEDALRVYGVEQCGGALQLKLPSTAELVEGVVRLAQACLRVADLTYTRRSLLQSAFAEQLEEVIGDCDFPYEQNCELRGRFDKLVRVDFLVHGAHLNSALLALASGNPSQAHVQANEIFRRWFDLDIPERQEQRVTVFDDTVDVYREDDIQRLKNLSEVVALSDRQSLVDLLAA